MFPFHMHNSEHVHMRVLEFFSEVSWRGGKLINVSSSILRVSPFVCYILRRNILVGGHPGYAWLATVFPPKHDNYAC